jgi:hypothetical protein
MKEFSSCLRKNIPRAHRAINFLVKFRTTSAVVLSLTSYPSFKERLCPSTRFKMLPRAIVLQIHFRKGMRAYDKTLLVILLRERFLINQQSHMTLLIQSHNVLMSHRVQKELTKCQFQHKTLLL